MSLRRKSRESALQLLFQSEFHPRESKKDLAWLDAEPKAKEYAETLYSGVCHNLQEIDKTIQKNSTNWKLERMPLVDLSIIRIAVLEMKHLNPPVPFATVINEAVELAKKFGTTDSKSFVNGILDQISKTE